MSARLWAGAAILMSAALSAVMVFPPQAHWLWNRTDSAPQGLYRVSAKPPQNGDWAVVSADATSAIWIAEHGFLGADWPTIKRVRGLPGDKICRNDARITINGTHVADALDVDSRGRDLPQWRGCLIVKFEEVFLLNDHPRSLDGRYFGATSRRDLAGTAHLVWQVSP